MSCGSLVRRSSGLCWWPLPTTPSRKSPNARTPASTAWPRAYGRETFQMPTAWPRCCTRAWSTSTPGGWSIRRLPSEASRPRASAASTATTVWTPTWSQRRFGQRCRGQGSRRRLRRGRSAVTRALATDALAQPASTTDSGSDSRSGRRWMAPLAIVCVLVMVAATVEIVLDAAQEHSPLIPRSPHIATWLRSLGGERLGYRVFLIALLAFSVAYVVLLVLARARSHSDRTAARWAIGLVAVLNLIVFAGPILISTDVFSYIGYARMGVVHGIDPYTHGPVAIVGDPVFRYVGHDWLKVATAYGPLYTLITYPLGLLGVIGALWGMKLYALIASAMTLALTWREARRRGRDRVFALLAVGANPLYVIYGLGGAHNDLIMLALMMAAVAFTLSDREAAAGATVVAGALVKATVAVLLPFMVLGRRRPIRDRPAPVLGACAALIVGALAGYAVFGIHGIDVVSALNSDSALASDR